MYGEVLTIVLEVMESEFGVFGFITDNGDLIVPSMTREVWDECQVPDKSIVFPPDTWGASLWGRAIREKRAYYSDGPFHTPEGHVHIDHFLTVPIVFGNETIGLISVANNERGYTEEDKDLLEGIANYISPILNARLQRDRQEQERKRTEEALRESEEKFRAIIEQATEGVVLIDEEGNIVEWNQANERMTGLRRDEVIGTPFWNMVMKIAAPERQTPQQRESIRATILEALQTGQSYMFAAPIELEFYPLSGKEECYVHQTIFPIKTETGYRLASLTHDITARKRAERELQRSNDLLRAIIEAAPVAIIDLDLDGNVQTVWNPAAEKMLGWSAQEAMGRFLPSVPVESQEEFRRFRERIRDGLTLDGVEVHRQRRDGSPIDYSIYASPLRDAEGRITGHIAVLVDITERRRAEAEREHLLAQIQEQAHRVQEVVDTVPEGVLLLDSDCRVVLTNPLGRKDLLSLAGVQVGDILTRLGDRPLAELLTSPPKGLWHEVAADSRSFQVLARPVENDATPKGWVLVVRDVTQQYESERRIQQQERLAAVGQLAAGIAHDFNNIMAVIVLHAQMGARSAALSDRDRGRLATINEQAHHATRLIQQILDFSRRAVLERQPLDLLPLLKEQVQLLERTLPEHIAVRLSYGHGEYTVNADPTRMQQMVTNLAVNARDAMPEGGVLSIALERITVKPGASPPLPELMNGDWIRLSVADTGVGIPPEVLPHVFEPFYTTKPPDLGSGLGLAQVYGIVAQHEGHIDVETQVGARTAFIIYLPALEAHPAVPLSPDVSIAPRGKGEVILVVEDNASLRATLRETLAEWGYQVQEAANGVQALALLEELGGAVNLVLSDVVMPEMGGVALAHALRERGWVMPVILLSGYPQERDVAELRAYGVSAWLSKPPALDQLARAVADALCTKPPGGCPSFSCVQ
jgi:two-component system cell cycle sensor histidine kinase/response regulator CckA